MNIDIICIGKLKDRFFEEAAAEYEKRLAAFGKIHICELSPAPLPDNPNEKQIQDALKKEGENILRQIPKNSFVIPLCIEGKLLSSEQLAAQFQKTALSGWGNICFIIGGSHGLSEEVKQKGTLRLSMSPMTFPHRLARVMLLEQIYRAFTITDGRRYHK